MGLLPNIRKQIDDVNNQLNDADNKLKAAVDAFINECRKQVTTLQASLKTDVFDMAGQQYAETKDEKVRKLVEDIINEIVIYNKSVSDLSKTLIIFDRGIMAAGYTDEQYYRDRINFYLNYETSYPIADIRFTRRATWLGSIYKSEIMQGALGTVIPTDPVSLIFTIGMEIPGVKEYVGKKIGEMYLFAVEALDPNLRAYRKDTERKANKISESADSIEKLISNYGNLLESLEKKIEAHFVNFTSGYTKTEDYKPAEPSMTEVHTITTQPAVAPQQIVTGMPAQAAPTVIPSVPMVYHGAEYMPTPEAYPYKIKLVPKTTIQNGAVITTYERIPLEMPLVDVSYYEGIRK